MDGRFWIPALPSAEYSNEATYSAIMDDRKNPFESAAMDGRFWIPALRSATSTSEVTNSAITDDRKEIGPQPC